MGFLGSISSLNHGLKEKHNMCYTKNKQKNESKTNIWKKIQYGKTSHYKQLSDKAIGMLYYIILY